MLKKPSSEIDVDSLFRRYDRGEISTVDLANILDRESAPTLMEKSERFVTSLVASTHRGAHYRSPKH